MNLPTIVTTINNNIALNVAIHFTPKQYQYYTYIIRKTASINTPNTPLAYGDVWLRISDHNRLVGHSAEQYYSLPNLPFTSLPQLYSRITL